MREQRCWFICSMVLLTSAVPPVALGQQQALEEIVVTARRVEERLQDVPISITVFNQQQLENRNVVNASDLAAYTPSLSADTRFGSELSSFAIRGFTQEVRTAPSVAVYFADVVAPRGGTIGAAGGDGAGPGAFFDLQNVQVLKGPQGTLFGRNTTGGAVLLVPAKPTSTFGGYGELSFGNYAMKRYQGVLNLPLNDRVRFRLGVDRQTRDGYENNISSLGPSRFANMDYVAARASMVVDITPNIENYTIATYSRSDTNSTLQQVFACNSQAPLALFTCPQVARQQGQGFYAVQNSTPAPESLITQWQAINTTAWHLNDLLTIKSIASYGEFRSDLRQDVFGTDFSVPLIIPGLGGLSLLGVSSNPAPGLHSNNQRTYSEELQFQGRSEDDRLTWQGGGYFEHSEPRDLTGSLSAAFIHCQNIDALQCTDVLGLLSGTPGFGGSVTGSLGSIAFHNYGLYTQATQAVTDKFKITGGVRYTIDRTSGVGEASVYRFPNPLDPAFYVQSCTNAPASLADGCRQSYQQNSHAPTWLIDFDYLPREDVLVYAKYARGYRQGSVNPFGATGFTTFAPEHVNSYEVGAKTGFHSVVSGIFNIAAFYNDFTDQQLLAGFQSSTNSAAPTTGIVNGGKSRIYGAEVETSIQPLKGLQFDVSASYLDTKLQSERPVTIPPGSAYDIVTFTAQVGGPLPFTPKFKASGTASYEIPLRKDVGSIVAAMTYVYTGPQTTAVDTPYGIVGSTHLVNANLNWTAIGGSRIDVSLFATNLFNEQYATYVPGVYNTGLGMEPRALGEPRMYGARFRVHLGN
jgi:iron complex outermembrane recepter protein